MNDELHAEIVIHGVHGHDRETGIVTCSCGRAMDEDAYEQHLLDTAELRS